MEVFSVCEADDNLKIICVGVGGGGCNIVSNMINQALEGISLIAIDTDTKSLEKINEVKKIQIGKTFLQDIGLDSKPLVGREHTIENYNEIKIALDGADIVFIIATFGSGSGTGTYESAVIANIAKNVGAFTISIITMPFQWEGMSSCRSTESGFDNIKQESDSLVIIQNEEMEDSFNIELNYENTLKVLNNAVKEAIYGITGVVLSRGDNDINLDIYDLKTVMSKGIALIGMGEYKGENSATKGILQSIEHTLLDDVVLSEAIGVLVHFNIHIDYPIMNILDAMDIIYERVNPDADIFIGMTTDKSLSKEYLKATIILTGFETNGYFNFE